MTDENEKNEEHEDDLLKDDGKDLQRIKSWVGRIEASSKKQQETLDAIAEKLEGSQSRKPEFGEDDQAKFNEKLHEMILNGKVMEALTLVNNVNNEAQKRIKAVDQKKFDAAVSEIAEDPIMKDEDLSKAVKETARSLMGQGYDAKTAVTHAKVTVENNALRNMVNSGGKSLDMLGSGGGKPPATPEKRLPPGAEKVYQNGKAKGYFKDRQDYIDNLDPRVRSEWGL